MTSTTRPSGRGMLGTVLVSQALRGVAYGLVAVQLGAVLRGRGLDSRDVGLVLAAIVAGSALASLALGRWGDRVGRARCYGLLYVALAIAGVVLAAGWPVWLLALVALSGALSTEVVESGPFTTLEQVMLASTAPQTRVTRGFGVYNAVATLAGAAGALIIGSIEIVQVLSGKLGWKGPFFDFLNQRLDFGALGYIIVGMFLVAWIGSVLLWKVRRVEDRYGNAISDATKS